ncbi:hypothetical protein LL260_004023, partial [Proteus mirabilis]
RQKAASSLTLQQCRFSRMFSYGGLGACAAEAKSAEDRGRYGDGCQLPSLPTRPILSAAPFSGRVAT